MLTKSLSTTFATEEECLSYLKELRWPNNQFTCPKCGHNQGTWSEDKKVMRCRSCHAPTSITAGSFFHAAKLPLMKLLPILIEVVSGITKAACEIEAEHSVAYSTAWGWLQKVRRFLQDNFCSSIESVAVDCEKIAAVLFRRSSESKPKELSGSQKAEEPEKQTGPPANDGPSESKGDDAEVRTVIEYVADNFQGVSRKHVQPYVAQCFIAMNHDLFTLETFLRAFMQSSPVTHEMISAYSSPQLVRLPVAGKRAA